MAPLCAYPKYRVVVKNMGFRLGQTLPHILALPLSNSKVQEREKVRWIHHIIESLCKCTHTHIHTHNRFTAEAYLREHPIQCPYLAVEKANTGWKEDHRRGSAGGIRPPTPVPFPEPHPSLPPSINVLKFSNGDSPNQRKWPPQIKQIFAKKECPSHSEIFLYLPICRGHKRGRGMISWRDSWVSTPKNAGRFKYIRLQARMQTGSPTCLLCFLFFSLMDTISCPVAKRREWVGKANSHVFQIYLQNRLCLCSLQGFGFLKNRILQPDRQREWEDSFSRNGQSFSWTFNVIQQSPGSCQLPVWCNVWERAAEYTWLNNIFWFAFLSLGKLHLSAPTSAAGSVRALGWACHRRIKRN